MEISNFNPCLAAELRTRPETLQLAFTEHPIMKQILITGSRGQLGNEIQSIANQFPHLQFLYTDVDELNLTDAQAVDSFFRNNQVDYVINCAAYTAVDKAEDDSELCYLINDTAVRHLANACTAHKSTLLHVSTDYVFDGTAHTPYTEEMPVSPNSVYGASKEAGEQSALSTPNAIVVRTSWLYSAFGANFVKTMLRLGHERDALNVIFDQVGTPTYAQDLAVALLRMVEYCESNPTPSGIYHFSNEGVCSWYDFTKEIHRQAGINNCYVQPIESSDYPTRATRPHYSVLNKKKIKATFGLVIPHWRESLETCIKRLTSENR